MDIIYTGGKYKVYDTGVTTYNTLPIGTYYIEFNQLEGFSLTPSANVAKAEKVYGRVEEIVDKILKGYQDSTRNFGVILSGIKGGGKSLTIKMLAEKAQYPIIIIDRNYENLTQFLASIQQEVILIFDEFDKVFTDRNRGFDTQDALLSLFDGIYESKKLFIIVCNESRSLDEYYLNRPGRFHYHFKYTVPSETEIKQYLLDNLNNPDPTTIELIIRCSSSTNMTFDCLRSICFELNRGYSLSESLADLNIRIEPKKYNLIVKFSNGRVETVNNYYLSPFTDEVVDFDLSFRDNNNEYIDMTIVFSANDIVRDVRNNLIVPGGDVEKKYTHYAPDITVIELVPVAGYDHGSLTRLLV